MIASNRAVVLLGDPSHPARRDVEEGRGTFQAWTRAAWGKRTRKDREQRAQSPIGVLMARVELADGTVVEMEPCRVRFVDKSSKLQYPSC